MPPLPVADDGLTPHQRAVLRDVLAPFAAGFSRVALFGSRATGRARPDSDIDLAVYGAAEPWLVDRLFTLFDESALPVRVDVVDYDRIEHAALRQHIDAVARVLFEATDLARAAISPSGE